MKESRKAWWKLYLSKLRFKRESEGPRLHGFTISNPSVSDEFHSLGPMRPVGPQDFITESSSDVATGQKDDDYRDSSSYYEEGTISPTGSFILRPIPTSDDFSEDFVVSYFPSSPYICLTQQRWLPVDGTLAPTLSAAMNGSYRRLLQAPPGSCLWTTLTPFSCPFTSAP